MGDIFAGVFHCLKDMNTFFSDLSTYFPLLLLCKQLVSCRSSMSDDKYNFLMRVIIPIKQKGLLLFISKPYCTATHSASMAHLSVFTLHTPSCNFVPLLIFAFCVLFTRHTSFYGTNDFMCCILHRFWHEFLHFPPHEVLLL